MSSTNLPVTNEFFAGISGEWESGADEPGVAAEPPFESDGPATEPAPPTLRSG
ncbi:MAG: hypothetical protein U0270_18400 [Labilithrix sp.]